MKGLGLIGGQRHVPTTTKASSILYVFRNIFVGSP